MDRVRGMSLNRLHGLQLLDVGGSVDAEQGILRGERHRGLRSVRVDHDCRWWAHRVPGRAVQPDWAIHPGLTMVSCASHHGQRRRPVAGRATEGCG